MNQYKAARGPVCSVQWSLCMFPLFLFYIFIQNKAKRQISQEKHVASTFSGRLLFWGPCSPGGADKKTSRVWDFLSRYFAKNRYDGALFWKFAGGITGQKRSKRTKIEFEWIEKQKQNTKQNESNPMPFSRHVLAAKKKEEPFLRYFFQTFFRVRNFVWPWLPAAAKKNKSLRCSFWIFSAKKLFHGALFFKFIGSSAGRRKIEQPQKNTKIEKKDRDWIRQDFLIMYLLTLHTVSNAMCSSRRNADVNHLVCNLEVRIQGLGFRARQHRLSS